MSGCRTSMDANMKFDILAGVNPKAVTSVLWTSGLFPCFISDEVEYLSEFRSLQCDTVVLGKILQPNRG